MTIGRHWAPDFDPGDRVYYNIEATARAARAYSNRCYQDADRLAYSGERWANPGDITLFSEQKAREARALYASAPEITRYWRSEAIIDAYSYARALGWLRAYQDARREIYLSRTLAERLAANRARNIAYEVQLGPIRVCSEGVAWVPDDRGVYRDCDGYDENGFDRDGFDSDDRDPDGFDRSGYDADGYDRNGYDSNGYDCDGYDRDDRDCDGIDREGNCRDGDCGGEDCVTCEGHGLPSYHSRDNRDRRNYFIPASSGPTFGVELETEDALRMWTKAPYAIIAESDGSLDDSGVEYVGPPLELSEYADGSMWHRWVTRLKDAGATTDSGRCGMHVHAGRAKWSERAQARAVVLTSYMQDVSELIAGRIDVGEDDDHDHTRGYYYRYGLRTVGSYERQSSRYCAVNVTDKTLEWRIFRGTVDWIEFKMRVQYVASLLAFGAEPARYWCGRRRYLDWLREHRTDYPDLFGFLDGRGVVDRWAPETSSLARSNNSEVSVCV